MQIENLYIEDGVVCMKVKDFPTIVYLDYHIDSRNLVKKFEMSIPGYCKENAILITSAEYVVLEAPQFQAQTRISESGEYYMYFTNIEEGRKIWYKTHNTIF